ncbi:MAG: response regulator transcription factor [Chloroflexota bacterium]|nr:response regulator transcription factor [Chloroflexota bacterium]
MKILAVDDERDFVELLRAALHLYRPGYNLVAAHTGQDALNLATVENPDLVLLDVMLPDMEGFQVCQEIRKASKVPIILITIRDREADIVKGLESGANDYVTKPFSYKVLMARIDAALRHSFEAQPPVVLRTGDLEIDLGKSQVRLRGQEVALTPREYSIVELLARHVGQPVSGQTLLTHIWGPEFVAEKQYLKTYVHRLHHKLEDDPSQPRYITTVRGVGYRLEKL